jgi:hypothetical protein
LDANTSSTTGKRGTTEIHVRVRVWSDIGQVRADADASLHLQTVTAVHTIATPAM